MATQCLHQCDRLYRDRAYRGARDNLERLVRTQRLVPEELLNRFNDRLIVIAPPTATEFSIGSGAFAPLFFSRPANEHDLTRLGQEAAASGK